MVIGRCCHGQLRGFSHKLIQTSDPAEAARRPASAAATGLWFVRRLKTSKTSMRFVVIFEEGSDMAPVRERHEPAHLAFLERHREEIPMAGGLRHEHGGAYVGGLWVFEVQTRARAIELIEQDPYYRVYPRKYRLLAWGKALPGHQVLM
jgi:uncharacterized protein YciI